jgi:KipI family sensor histidine kinase inhibitor
VRFLPAGPRAVLVEVADTGAAQALYQQARRHRVRAADVVPGARSVLFDGVEDPAGLAEQVRRWSPAAAVSAQGPLVEVPTRYDGADLDEVARCWEMTRAEVVATHSGTAFQVAFCGFAPGFAYCTGLTRTVPRRPSPRQEVPAGAVGLADEFTGIYPRASPGGWQLIGRTDLRVWDTDRDPPALLTPGTRVRFVEAVR